MERLVKRRNLIRRKEKQSTSSPKDEVFLPTAETMNQKNNLGINALNPMQKQAVLHTEGPLLILAGPGTGKTSVLTYRIAYLLCAKKVRAENILAVTFTNKAAVEMKQRVDMIAGRQAQNVWISTFHSMCTTILRNNIDHIGYSLNFSIYDTSDQKTIIRLVCKKLNVNTELYPEKMLLSKISAAKERLLTPKAYLMSAGKNFMERRIASVYEVYQTYLEKNNALDFDDLILKTIELLETDREVCNYYQNLFQYILIDEYQDTNLPQFKLISILARKYKNLCVVGDDDQSIYRFRGADIGNILSFENQYKDAGIIKLEQNYRSTKNIIEAANAVIAANKNRKTKQLWTENKDGEKIHFLQVSTGRDEAAYIAGDIAEKIERGMRNGYHQFALLYRTNEQSRVLEERLVTEGIPYKIVNGVSFYQRREVKDILAYISISAGVTDNVAVRRIINIPRRKIGITVVEKIADIAEKNDVSFYEVLTHADELPLGRNQIKSIENFLYLIYELREKWENGNMPLQDWIAYLIEKTGYAAMLQDEQTPEAAERLGNIKELITKAADYNCYGTGTPEGFLENIALIGVQSTEKQDCVTLMTVHAAKGLEFEEVYLCGMETGIFPNYNVSNDMDMEEERRLCYVAITRAKENLTILAAKSRMLAGQILQNSSISPFIGDIPKRCMTTIQYPTPTQQKNVFLPFDTGKNIKSTNLVKKPDYTVGDTVKHPVLGIGVVTDIKKIASDYIVTVAFKNKGIKKLFANVAGLEKIRNK